MSDYIGTHIGLLWLFVTVGGLLLVRRIEKIEDRLRGEGKEKDK